MTAAYPILLVVAGALHDGTGRVLLQRRGGGGAEAGLWEFPGGKIDPGESPEAALIRELAEELGVRIDPAAVEPVGFASAAPSGRRLLLLLYLVHRWTGEPHAQVADALRWERPGDMAVLPMPAPDYPLAVQLARRLG